MQMMLVIPKDFPLIVHYLGWFQIMTPVFGAEIILCNITGAGAGQGRFFCRGRLCNTHDPWRSLVFVGFCGKHLAAGWLARSQEKKWWKKELQEFF